MLRKLVCIAGVSILFFTYASYAKDGARFRHADKNKDGVLSKREIRAEKKWEQKQRAKVNTPAEAKADTNKDGIVDRKERDNWKDLTSEIADLNKDGKISPRERRCFWKNASARVNTSIEAKYDLNHDGWLDPKEARSYLEDRYRILMSQGSVPAESTLITAYDANKDGKITGKESEALKEDLSGE